METSTIDTNGTAHTLAQAIPSRNLVKWATPRDQLVTRDLESVRDLLRKRRGAQEPIDHARSLSQAHLKFGDGSTRRAAFAFLKPGGLEEPMALTHHALRALGREVLPGRGLDFLLEEAALHEQGRKLADLNWATFAQRATDPKMVRTIRMRDPITGETRRTVRSVHSTDYAPYDNLEFVEDLLSGGYDRMPLIAFQETDQSIKLKFALGGFDLGEGNVFGEGHNFLTGADGKRGIVIPMVEAWNSEAGSRAVTLKPGMFRLICTNTAGSWEDQKTFRWIHRGDRSRIQIGVKDCLTELRTTASGTVKAYEQAVDVAIDDAYAWFERAVNGEELGKGEKEAIRAAFHHETTTPGGMLATVVDAVTLIAQDAIDEFEQERIERVGSNLLRRGLSESLKHGGKILVEA